MKRRKIRFWLILALVGVVGGLVGYLRLFSGQVMQRLQSPNGQTVATIRKFGRLSGNLTGIELRARREPLRHFVLTGLDYDDGLSISWENPRNLIVQCTNCTDISIYRCEQRWHDVTIHYVWHGGSPDYPATTFSKGVGELRRISKAPTISCRIVVEKSRL